MHSVIPALNCHKGDDECVREQLAIARSIGAQWVHLDVADGAFTYHKTWNHPERWGGFQPAMDLEVHLMTETPLEEATRWLQTGAKRLIVHVETIQKESFSAIAGLCVAHGAELILALNPETPVGRVHPFSKNAQGYQILAVHPGLAGQAFLWPVLEKIKMLRREFPNATIEVDGGVEPHVGQRALEAGADILVSASYIFHAQDPARAYAELIDL